MPHAKLPTTLKGWLISTAAALVGLIAGFVTIEYLGRIVK